VGVVELAVTVVSIALVDRWGRRPLFALGLTFVTLTLLLLAFVFWQQALLGAAAKWMMLAVLMGYISAFALSLGAVCGLVISEIFPQQFRVVAMSIVTLFVRRTRVWETEDLPRHTRRGCRQK
jgi:MFS family permease